MTGIPENLWPVYRSQSLSSFPTAAKAIDRLKRFSSPPLNTIDNSRPSSRIETACQAITSLAFHMQLDIEATSLQLWNNWEPSIAKWVVFLLRKLLLTHQNSSLGTVDGTNNLEHLLFSIPDLLDHENELPFSEAVKHGSSLYLQPLTAQIWYLLVEIEHPHLVAWSSLLLDLVVCPNAPLPSACLAFSAPPNDSRLSNIPILYSLDAKLGEMLLQRLNNRIARLHAKDLKRYELNELKYVLMVLTTGSQCFKGFNPILIGEDNHNTTLRLMTRILSVLLVKKAFLHKKPAGTLELLEAHEIVTSILIAFTHLLPIDTPSRIQQIVESGIVEALYYAADYYVDSAGRQYTFAQTASGVLDIIATFLVHYSILRPFVRRVRKFWDCYLVGFPPRIEHSGLLKRSWTNILSKAVELYGSREGIKQRGVCDYSLCPISRAEPSEAHSKIQYLRCMGCSANIYCSLTCRAGDWRQGHRMECPQRAQAVRDGTLPVTRADIMLCGLLAKSYLHANAQTLTSMIKNYRNSHPSLREMGRNPIIYLDFNRPDPPPTRDVKLLDGAHDQGGLSGANLGFFEELEGQWNDIGLDKVLMWASFPVRTGVSAYPFLLVVSFPIRWDGAPFLDRSWLKGFADEKGQ
ncbi:hypothetical protein PM082_024120 [Marasmius tenuissimus]|nr:hypothetical protein PM082_024120 [Marasmius tenuissimus]